MCIYKSKVVTLLLCFLKRIKLTFIKNSDRNFGSLRLFLRSLLLFLLSCNSALKLPPFSLPFSFTYSFKDFDFFVPLVESSNDYLLQPHSTQNLSLSSKFSPQRFLDRKQDFQIRNEIVTLKTRFIYWKQDFQIGNQIFTADAIFLLLLGMNIFRLETRFYIGNTIFRMEIGFLHGSEICRLKHDFCVGNEIFNLETFLAKK